MDWFSWYYLVDWSIRILMLVEVPRRRSPQSAMAWLLIIMFLPIPGLVLYLIFGLQITSRHLLIRKDTLLTALEESRLRFVDLMATYLLKENVNYGPTSRIVERFGGMPALTGNSVELIDDADHFIDRLVDDIDAAEDYVHLLYYIFVADRLGLRVADAMVRAAERGVTCRLLVDSMGSRKFLNRHGGRLRRLGVEVVGALPMISIKRFLGRVDWRTHRKIAVIDGSTGYTGSQNIVDPTYGHDEPDLVWHDLVARIKGPVTVTLETIFLSDWFLETGDDTRRESLMENVRPAGEFTVQVLPSGPIYAPNTYQRLLTSAIYQAVDRIIITSPYFIPDEALLQALETACRRGVELHLVVPMKSDQFLPGYAARSYFDDLLSWGVTIHLYTSGLLHVKSVSIDDNICFFGSSNFDVRSFALNFEIDLLLYGTEESSLLRNYQQKFIEQSDNLDAGEWSRRPRAIKVMENLARLLSPML